MDDVIGDAAELTPDRLTEILRTKGVLNRGHVTRVDAAASRSLFVSVVAHLHITYSRDATPGAPERLFLKVSNVTTNAPPPAPPEEIVFYESIAAATPDAPVPRCYDAAFSRAPDRSHLLLDDLSSTHGHPPFPLTPARAECEAAVDVLARFHAHWWEHPRLGNGVGRLLDDAGVASLASSTAARFAQFADVAGDALSPARRRTIERVIGAFPRPWSRLSDIRGLTLTHGDAHTWNFLFPRTAQARRVFLIDWQLWHPHIGPRDLAFMMTIFWEPVRRARLEQPLLRRYHAALIENGVRGYDWDRCWDDYRWSAVRNVFIPMLQWSRGTKPSFWQPNFERAMAAFDDLRCIELIDR
jgi:hypothetical protein